MKIRFPLLAIGVIALVALSAYAADYVKKVTSVVDASVAKLQTQVVAINDVGNQLENGINRVQTAVDSTTNKVSDIQTKIASLKTGNAQDILANACSAVNEAIEIPTALAPVVDELNSIVTLIATKLLPALRQIPGVVIPTTITQSMDTVTKRVTTVTSTIKTVSPQLKNITEKISAHTVAIKQEADSIGRDISKIL